MLAEIKDPTKKPEVPFERLDTMQKMAITQVAELFAEVLVQKAAFKSLSQEDMVPALLELLDVGAFYIEADGDELSLVSNIKGNDARYVIKDAPIQ